MTKVSKPYVLGEALTVVGLDDILISVTLIVE